MLESIKIRLKIMEISKSSDFFKSFLKGDLVYGTSIDRQFYCSVAAEKYPAEEVIATIDKLTFKMDWKIRKGNSYASPIGPTELGCLAADAQAFYEYARDKSGFWNKMQGIGTSDRTKHNVPKGMPNYKGIKLTEAYLRAKCKAGIGFILSLGFRIHFALDSLGNSETMEAIARKEPDQPWYTGTELRYLFKNQDLPQVKEGVFFYVAGCRVCPPWKKPEFIPIWDNYGKTRDHLKPKNDSDSD